MNWEGIVVVLSLNAKSLLVILGFGRLDNRRPRFPGASNSGKLVRLGRTHSSFRVRVRIRWFVRCGPAFQAHRIQGNQCAWDARRVRSGFEFRSVSSMQSRFPGASDSAKLVRLGRTQGSFRVRVRVRSGFEFGFRWFDTAPLSRRIEFGEIGAPGTHAGFIQGSS